MAREDKVAVVDRVTEQFSEAAATLLTDYRGLTVEELAELRAELRKVDASYAVVKNTLARIAATNAGLDGLDELLVGPTALVFCGEDPVGPAKALKAFGKDHEALVVKGGYLEGKVLDAEAAIKLAELESREDLLARLAGMMNNALAGFARLLQAPIADMARLMGALEAEGGVEAKGFSPSTPAAAPEAAPAEDEATDEEPEAPEAAAAEEEAPAAAAVAEEEPEAAAADEEPAEEPEAAADDEPAEEPEAAADDEPDEEPDVPAADEDAAAPAGDESAEDDADEDEGSDDSEDSEDSDDSDDD